MSTTKTTQNTQLDELFTLQELTDRLKVKSGWVYQHIHGQSLPFPYVKIGHYLRFPASGIQKYIEMQTRNGE